MGIWGWGSGLETHVHPQADSCRCTRQNQYSGQQKKKKRPIGNVKSLQGGKLGTAPKGGEAH